MTRQNKTFAILQSVYIVFALMMVVLNSQWYGAPGGPAIKFTWQGWVWQASIVLALIDIVRIYRVKTSKTPSDELVICDEDAAPVEEITAKEPMQL